MTRTVEICLTDLASAAAAAEGGADRIELCADLASGGVTPSLGLVRSACRGVVPVHVLIRPRAGDFAYSEAELDAMALDVGHAREAGASGVVLGVLRDDATVDLRAVARLVAEARPMAVTFHRAIDLTPDPPGSLDALVALGVDRVLTAGGRGPARRGVGAIRDLVGRAAGRVEIMAGGGIAEADLPGLLDATGASAVHLGSGVTRPAPAAGPFGARPAAVDAERVRRIVRLVRRGRTP